MSRNDNGNFNGFYGGRSISNGPCGSITRRHNGQPTITSLLVKVVGKRPVSIRQAQEKLYARFGVEASYNTVRNSLIRHPNTFRDVGGYGSPQFTTR